MADNTGVPRRSTRKRKSTKISPEQPQKVSRVDVLEGESSQDYNDGAESVDMREIMEDIPTEQEGNPRKRKHSPTEQQPTNVKASRNEVLEDNSRVNCLGIHHHSDVYQECKHCSANWYTIGLNLRIPQYTLDIIKKNNPLDSELCMSEMLSRWLKRVDEKSIPSWRRLCQALCDVDKSTADQIAEKHHVTDYNKQKDIITTSPGDSDQCYIGQMMFQRIGNQEWLAKFMVFKDDSKRKKYLTNNQSKYEEGERIPFHFRDPIDGYVELDLIPSQDMCSKGWTLKSDKAPLRITKKSVDRCGTKEPYSVCIIRVSATSNADSELSYDIPLVGADDNITITISRTINDLAPYYSTCDCGECTIGRMIQGDKCTKPGKKWFPGLLLLNRAHTSSLLSQLHRGIVETGEAYSETEELETKFGRYSTQTLNRLDESVGRKFFGRYRQLTWESVYKKLADRFVESRNLRVDNIISLKAYLLDELRISWFNFLPVQKIAEWFLSSQSDLQQNWNEYIIQRLLH